MATARDELLDHHQFAKAPSAGRRRVLMMMAAVLWCSAISAQDAPPPQPTAVEKPEPAPVDDAREKLKSRQKRRVTIGLAVAALVTVSGAALLVFTVLGGIATRRGLRSPLTEDERTLHPGAAPPALDPNLNEAPSDFDIAESPREESPDEESE